MQCEANAFDSGERSCRFLDSRMRTAGPGSAPHLWEEVLFLFFLWLREPSPCPKRPGTDDQLGSGATEGLTG